MVAAGPALAHAILVESSPAIDGSAPGPKVDFDLRYNSRIDQRFSRLTLSGPEPAGEPRILPIDPGSEIDRLRASATLGPGRYTLRWQVLATDGHITRGDIPFTVGATPAK